MAAESYQIDRNAFPYPKNNSRHVSQIYELTTPVAYISSLDLEDPFNTRQMDQMGQLNMNYTSYIWGNYRGEWGTWWASTHGVTIADLPNGFSINSSGPDHSFSSAMHIVLEKRLNLPVTGIVYSPSNGLYSIGDIIRYGGEVSQVMGGS